jgi:hypothetical protein
MADKDEVVEGVSIGRDREEREDEAEAAIPNSGKGGSRDATDGLA